MSEIVQWIIVLAIAAVAVLFLAKRFRRAAKGCCTACPYADSCSRADKRLSVCPEPPKQDKSQQR